MTNFTFKKNFKMSKLLTVVLVALSVNSIAFANNGNVDNSEWHPVASDKLIHLPANIIEKRIQQDFQASPMAIHLAELEIQMQDKISF